MVKEATFEIRGLKIAAVLHNDPNGIPTIALHGWLDNAASFERLAPLLPKQYIVALDLPGHGLSDHVSSNVIIHVIDYCTYVLQVAQALGWQRFALLGHSLGAGIGSLIAGILGDRIIFATFIDGLGIITSRSETSVYQYKSFVNDLLSKPYRVSPTYMSFEEAVETRLKINKMLPDSMAILVKRGLKQQGDKWVWRTDPKLLMPTPIRLTEDQNTSFLKEITCPITLIKPTPGYPFPEEMIQRRIQAIPHLNVQTIAGEHHVHLDDPQTVANAIHRFLSGVQI
jgi:pimeloyl-ACP methyl ester carboxylesterase